MIASGLLVGFILAFSFSHLIALITQERSTFLRARVCESCGTEQSLFFRIPMIGGLIRSGGCPSCGYTLPPLYAVFELLIIGFSLWAFSVLSFSPALQISLIGFALLGASYMDLKKWIIPNAFVVYVLIAVLLGLISGSTSVQFAAFGLVVGAIVSVFIILPQKFGGGEGIVALGDVKLVLALSLWLGWVLSIYVFFLASFLGFAYWVFSGFFRGFSTERRVPFGPFVALSTMIFGIGRVLDPQFVTHLLTFRF